MKCKIPIGSSEEICLLDTCCELNLISKEKAMVKNLTIEPYEGKLFPIKNKNESSKSIKTFGRVTESILVGDQFVDIDFIIVEEIIKDVNYLIGLEGMKKLGVSIKISDRTQVSFGDNMYEIAQEESETAEVRAKEKHTFLPLQVVPTFPIKFDKEFFDRNNVKDAVFSPSKASTFGPLEIIGGKFDSNTMYISLINKSTEVFTLEPDTLLGHLSIDQYKIFAIDVDNDEATYFPTKTQKERNNQNFSHLQEIDQKTFEDFISNGMSKNLTAEQKKKYRDLLVKWKTLFAVNPKSPGLTTKTTAFIPLEKPIPPIRCRPYRYSAGAMEELKKQILEMLEYGIIRKSSSAWAFPVVLAIKADGSWRFCCDYSKLTPHVKRDAFCLPRIDDNLDRLKEAKYITVLDLASGFWQIPIEEADKEKLAFITPMGNYEWNVLPFGFTNSPAIFQRAISETLDPFLYICCLVFIDDIAIYSDSFEQHLMDCEAIFTKLAEYRWKVKISKCQFGMQEVNYLGHIVGNGEIKPLARNVDKLKQMKKPLNPDDLISFLGLTGYYKRFIEGYDYLIKPLRILTKKDCKWKWGEEQEEAYRKLIELLTSQPILKLPDLSKKFIVKTDASSFAWGAVLAQEYDGVEFPVAFSSGSLNQTQRNWPTWKREGYACMKAINQWKHYLLGVEFNLVTDHAALKYILDPEKKHPPIIANWIVQLSEYKYHVEHRAGKTLVLEDALSRSPNFLVISKQGIQDLQDEDKIVSKIKKAVLNNLKLESDLENYTKCNANNFVVEDDILFYVDLSTNLNHRRIKRIVLVPKNINEVLDHLHKTPTGGHLGLDKLFSRVSQEYWFINMYQTIKDYYENCEVCAINRPMKKFNSYLQHPEPNEPFEIIQCDHIEVKVPTVPDGFKYILTVVDVFSKFVWFLPAKTQNVVETYDLLFKHVFGPNRFCKLFQTDKGTAFDNNLAELIAKSTGMQHKYNLPNAINHKGITGAVENKNKLCWNILRKFVEQDNQADWDKYLWPAAFAHNNTPNKSISNFTPSYCKNLQAPFSIIDLSNLSEVQTQEKHMQDYAKKLEEAWSLVKKSQKEANQKMDNQRNNYLKNRNLPTYVPGDLIIIKQRPEWVASNLNAKLAPSNLGPYPISKVLENNHILIDVDGDQPLEVHLDEVAPYRVKNIQDELSKKCFKGKFSEKFIIKEIPDVYANDIQWDECLPILENNNFNVKSIVGKRIMVWWPSFKKYYTGIVIGYTNDLKKNLIFYDVRNEDVPIEIDFGSSKLFKDKDNARIEKWRILPDFPNMNQ